MERIIQINLKNDTEKVLPANLPNSDRKEPESSPSRKRLHRLLDKAAHRAAAEIGRNRIGIFSK